MGQMEIDMEYISNKYPLLREIRKAFNEGVKAAHAGQDYSKNPYGNLLWSRRSQELMKQWIRGFDAGKTAKDNLRR
jgi:hypothetical protein